jgi:hypothetical protein
LGVFILQRHRVTTKSINYDISYLKKDLSGSS